MDNILTLITKENISTLEDIDYMVKQVTKGKAKNIKGYQAENLKNRGLSSSLTFTSF